MNIFILDKAIKENAKAHCDKHVVKMILESAQIICSALNIASGAQIMCYKTTHANHPSVIWARESVDNIDYLCQLMNNLDEVRMTTFNKTIPHKSVTLLPYEDVMKVARAVLPSIGLTPFPLVMPDEYKISSDPIECYREYYRKGKKSLLTYTGREKPVWLEA